MGTQQEELEERGGEEKRREEGREYLITEGTVIWLMG